MLQLVDPEKYRGLPFKNTTVKQPESILAELGGTWAWCVSPSPTRSTGRWSSMPLADWRCAPVQVGYWWLLQYMAPDQILHTSNAHWHGVAALKCFCPASLSEGRRPFLRAGTKCIPGKLMKIDWLAPKPIGGSYGFWISYIYIYCRLYHTSLICSPRLGLVFGPPKLADGPAGPRKGYWITVLYSPCFFQSHR